MNSRKKMNRANLRSLRGDRDGREDKNHDRPPENDKRELFQTRVSAEDVDEYLPNNPEAQPDADQRSHPVCAPVLIAGNRLHMIQSEKRSLLDNLEHGIGEEDRKLTGQPAPNHHDSNDQL